MAGENYYDELVRRICELHDADKHEEILSLLNEIPRDDWDFNLTNLYARALNNTERYEEALKLLLDVKDKGVDDGVWNFRIGFSLYYLGREAEAAECFQKAIDCGEDSVDVRALLRASREEARIKEEKTHYSPEVYSEEELSCIQAHIEKHFGENQNVFHEIVSPDIHVDVVIIEPTAEHNYYILVTMGMGAHKMNVPKELKEHNLEKAELIICLPPDWKMTEEAMKDEIWYWPLRWLKIMARLPLDQNTWLGWGHTVPSEGPFARNAQFTAILLLSPGAFGGAACECELPDGSRVNFYQMIPLYEEETQYKLKTDVKQLLELFNDESLECVNLNRENVCKNK